MTVTYKCLLSLSSAHTDCLLECPQKDAAVVTAIVAEITWDFSFFFIHCRCPLPAGQLEPSQRPAAIKQAWGSPDVQPVGAEDHRAVFTGYACGEHRRTQ